MSRQIPLARPSFGPEEAAVVAAVLESGWVVQGPRVAEFEQGFAAFVAADHAVAMSSCTTALHASIVALGVGPGDEVIVPALTWIATANVIEQVGATPVFADIRSDTFNVDERLLEPLFTERTVGVVPVHLFGLAADMSGIVEAAHRRGLWVLEDAACGLGAEIYGVHVGTFGEAACFSFHPRKSITTGEGGMVVTNDAGLARTLRSLRDHGAEAVPHAASPAPASMPSFPRVGFNYRMTDIQGAIGIVQLGRAAEFIAERRRIAARYDVALGDLEWLRTPITPEGSRHGFQSYVVMIRLDWDTGLPTERDARWRDGLMQRLEDQGIGSRPGTHAPPLSEYYRTQYGHRPEDFPRAAVAERLSVALPLYPGLTESDIEWVVETIRSYKGPR
jgi:perosamine synthetase